MKTFSMAMKTFSMKEEAALPFPSDLNHPGWLFLSSTGDPAGFGWSGALP